jgi:hypothetical protein
MQSSSKGDLSRLVAVTFGDIGDGILAQPHRVLTAVKIRA